MGTEPTCNDGVVSTDQTFKNCTTKALGFTVDDASATPDGDFVEVMVGVAAQVNQGEVTINPNNKGGATKSIGYLAKKAVQGGTRLNVGTQGLCNEGTVTTNNLHLKCSTAFLGYALPIK